MKTSVFRYMVIGLCVFTLMGSVVEAADSINELQNIRALAGTKDYQEAMKRLDDYLDKNPGDAQGRFLKGILFSDQKQFDNAIKIFISLTEDYPELPEPYNNLAVLYAGRGKYLKARDALLVAIKTHPSYATAHENLGDIYAMMASEAYKNALELDGENQSAKTKLAMIRDLFPKQPASTANFAANEKADQPVEQEPIAAVQEGEFGIPSLTSFPGRQVPESDVKAGVLATLDAWARAWSDKNAEGYIRFYATTFIPPNGRSFSLWKKLRRKRILAPRSISVEIINPHVVMLRDDKARVRFIQKYRSNTYRDTVHKTIEMVNVNDNWRFIREQAE